MREMWLRSQCDRHGFVESLRCRSPLRDVLDAVRSSKLKFIHSAIARNSLPQIWNGCKLVWWSRKFALHANL
jgi:hypothetical protein